MFFGNRSTLDTATRVDARHAAEVKAWWRDWHRYLTARVQLLETRQAEATQAPSFERSEHAWEEQRAAAEQTLKRLPHERRVVFERACEARRVTVQAALEARQRGTGAAHAGMLDPETVERETLAELLADAEGRADGQEAGFGVTPFFDRMYSVQIDALVHAPHAADYSLVPEGTTDHRRLWGLVAALLLGGVIIVWWTWPRGTEAAHGAAPGVLQVNGQAVEPWAVVAVTAVDRSGVRTSLPVSPTDALHWPGEATRVAAWQRTALRPLQLCLPSDMLQRTTALEVQADGDLPTRVYRLVEQASRQADLLLSACGAGEAMPRHGMLERIIPHPDQPLDQPVAVGPDGLTLRVRAISVIGTGQDPSVPADTYRVIVRVMPSITDVSWATLDPRLVMQNGLDAVPSAPVTADQRGDTVDVVYLVPAFTSPLAAAWSITDPRSKARARWRVTLDPPPGRAAVLRDALQIKVLGERGTTPGSSIVRIELRNRGSMPVLLTPDDLAITQGNRTVLGAEPTPARITVEPGKVRMLELPLRGIDWQEEVRVRVGGAIFRLQFGRDATR